MELCRLMVFLSALSAFFLVLNASAGDADPIYKACVGECEKTGCVRELCFPHCNFSADGDFTVDSWYRQEPLYIQWKEWDCLSTCRYHCMLVREEEKEKLGDRPVKYHGKWPLRRGFGIQVELTEALNISSAVAVLGFSLIVALLRAFNVREEAYRVMVSAPLISFVTTHILYLNFYQLDYMCGAMAIWAGVTKHPSRWKVRVFVVGAILATLMKIYDFPPYQGLVDAHAVWHAISISYLLWSSVRDDSGYRTSALVKKSK